MSLNLINKFKYTIGSLLLWVSCFFIPSMQAQTQSQIIEQAINKELYKKNTWKKLLVYEDGLFGLKSPIKNKDFFFAKDGATNPKAEMIATINAFYSRKNYKALDLHPQCRMIARKTWILKELGLSYDVLPNQKCPKYQQWSHKNKVTSISLIFSTGYLGNPASFFGHPLLKFNVEDERGNSSLLDYSLNYGALTGDNDDPISYSLKGLFGGYNAAFTHIQFFYHNHNYSEVELRDMWEYKLNLTQDQVDMIVMHAWEMLGREITYFFTQDNCAYRMAELINLVVDEQILPQFVPYAIPHTMFDRIAHMKLPNGEPLVKSLKYRPSRQTKLTKKYKSLNDDSTQLVLDVVNNKATLESIKFETKGIDEKIKITNTLIDYSMFLLASDKENKLYKKMRQKYLLARSKLPLQAIEKVDSEIAPIHEGQRPVLTRLSLGNTRDGVAFHDFEWRPAYYDLLSPDTGRLPFSSLAIWKMEMRLIEERLILRELDFFDVSAFNIASTDLPGDGSFAWKFRLGITSQSILCEECQVAAMKLGFGKAWEIDGKIAPYFFIGPNLTSSLNDIGTTGSLSEIGTIITLSDDYRMIINQSYSKFYNQDEQYLETFSVDQRFGSERTWDIRLGYKYQLASEYELALSYYW